MELYFAPLACSMATRIALYEAGLEARFHQVDTRTKRLADGSDFRAVNPMGQVPVLRAETGELLTENAAVLQYVADRAPQSGLAPQSGFGRYRLQQHLNFIASELHKLVFTPLLDRTADDGAKAYAREKATQRFAHLAAQVEGRDFLLDRFTVADAYLVTVLNWAQFVGIDFAGQAPLDAYFRGILARPSVARALAEENALFAEQQARRKAS